MTIAIYPGTFDPITNGHQDIVQRALKLFDRVIVAVAENRRKQPLFSLAERVRMVTEVLQDSPQAQVIPFSGLLVDCAKQHQARVILRGLRAVSDFELEFQLASMNRRLRPELETLLLIPSEKYTFLSSHLVREMASLGADIGEYVHPNVVKALKKAYQQ